MEMLTILEKGIELSKQGREIAALPGYTSLTRIRQVQGDVDGAWDVLQKAHQLAIQFDTIAWRNEAIVALFQARLWIAQPFNVRSTKPRSILRIVVHIQ